MPVRNSMLGLGTWCALWIMLPTISNAEPILALLLFEVFYRKCQLRTWQVVDDAQLSNAILALLISYELYLWVLIWAFKHWHEHTSKFGVTLKSLFFIINHLIDLKEFLHWFSNTPTFQSALCYPVRGHQSIWTLGNKGFSLWKKISCNHV